MSQVPGFPMDRGTGGYPSSAEVSIPGIWFEAELQRFRSEDGRQVTQRRVRHIWQRLGRLTNLKATKIRATGASYIIYTCLKNIYAFIYIYTYIYIHIHTYVQMYLYFYDSPRIRGMIFNPAPSHLRQVQIVFKSQQPPE